MRNTSDDAIDQAILDHAVSYVSIELETLFLDGTIYLDLIQKWNFRANMRLGGPRTETKLV